MPNHPPRFGAAPAKPKPWARPAFAPDHRLRGRAGMRQRQQVREEEPLCRLCLDEGRTTATVEIDHIKPLSEGGSSDRSNLQGLCKPHHDAKSAAERAEARRG